MQQRQFGGPGGPSGSSSGPGGEPRGERSFGGDRGGDRGESRSYGGDRGGDRGDRGGDRGDRGDRGGFGGRPGGRGRDFRSRRKVCQFCVEHMRDIDYRDISRLRRYLSDRGKIEPRRKTGCCSKHQRRLGVALKNARFMAMLPYTASHIRGV